MPEDLRSASRPPRSRPPLVAGTVVALSLATLALTPAPQLSLEEVVRRVEAYVASYGGRASMVVCTERYTQTMSGSSSYGSQRRTIRAEFAIARVDTTREWVGFRDVLEVDGAALDHGRGRLVHALSGGEGGYTEARRISDDSARFNIGKVQRNFNVPTTALFFFTAANHDRFKFTKKDAGADGIWQIDFRETSLPTLIATPGGTAVPSSGTIWVRAADGTVVRTLLKTDLSRDAAAPDQRAGGHIDVTYRFAATLAMWLPAEMTEEYEATRGQAWNRVRGDAAYDGYRQFTTSVRIK